jgi:hypothetical protein
MHIGKEEECQMSQFLCLLLFEWMLEREENYSTTTTKYDDVSWIFNQIYHSLLHYYSSRPPQLDSSCMLRAVTYIPNNYAAVILRQTFILTTTLGSLNSSCLISICKRESPRKKWGTEGWVLIHSMKIFSRIIMFLSVDRYLILFSHTYCFS